LIAFVDESVYDPPPGAYVLGCVVLPDNAQECAAIRAALTLQGRFHFYGATPQRKRKMAEQIGSWHLLSSAYVRRGLYPLGQERSRDRCLEYLLRDLRSWGVVEVVFESRGRYRNSLDEEAVKRATVAMQAPIDLKYSWVNGEDDCLLWLADAVASTVRGSLARTVHPYGPHLQTMRVFQRQVL
jgi:hypothetical protein